MPLDEEKFDSFEDEAPSDFVPAIFARSVDEAEKYRELLDDHDIPALVGSEDFGNKKDKRKMSRGVPVLVPESLLDEASEIIAEKEELDEFETDDENEEGEDIEEISDGADEDDDDDDEEFEFDEEEDSEEGEFDDDLFEGGDEEEDDEEL